MEERKEGEKKSEEQKKKRKKIQWKTKKECPTIDVCLDIYLQRILGTEKSQSVAPETVPATMGLQGPHC
ncbi:hypothetical protein FKM82_002743 [Ascaphus truei]